MDVSKLFEDLESNNTHEAEEAKKKLAEFVNQNQTKDQTILQGLLDYYARTNSVRMMDVLVKVQPPNDVCVLDRITDWMRGQYRAVALDLLGFIIRKHPTWLYKIAKHKLIKEILRLLQTEKEVTHLMSALLCIITLLPIIPSSVPSFLTDLLDGFGHLATWSAQNASSLPQSLIVHVQIGTYLLFHYLYGMYPNSFIRYLRRFAAKDSAIYHSTISPLLETVRIHPMLVSSTAEDEANITRWKEKEPHDIVEACAKLSLDYNQENVMYFCKNAVMSRESTAGDAEMTHLPLRNWPKAPGSCDAMASASFAPRSLDDGSNLLAVQKMNYPMWSPSVELLSTPPPTSAVMHTPTPNYNVPPNLMATANVPGAAGASPPEAAVEATPENTPLKNDTIKPSSSAVRALLVTSPPASPSKHKEKSTFDFGSQTPGPKSQRLRQINLDRSESKRKLSTQNSDEMHTIRVNNDPSQQQQLDSPTTMTESTQEDQEVQQLTSTANHSDTLQDISADCGDETEQSPCSIGGLNPIVCPHLTLQQRRASRNLCFNDTSHYLSQATSPTDNQHIERCKIATNAFTVRRSRSSPVLQCTECSGCIVARQLEYNNFQTNGDTSSPSGDDAVSAATHFKQIQQKSRSTKPIDGRLFVYQKDTCTQTLPQWHYEERIFEVFLEMNQRRQQSQKKPFDPYEMFDQCVSRNVTDTKIREEVLKDQIRLLHALLNFERYRREVHAERNRRLMGKSRTVRSQEKDEDRLRDQLRNQMDEIDKLNRHAAHTRRISAEQQDALLSEMNLWKTKYQTEVETSKLLRSTADSLHRRINDEATGRKEMALQIEALRGELFDMRNEMQQVQYQAELGQQYKQELVKLQSELMVVGEVQVKCRDKLTELDSLKARDEEALELQDTYSKEIRETRSALEMKCAQFDTITHQIGVLQANNATKDNNFTDQKRLLKAAKEEYEEKLKALEGKYDIQKKVILQMEERIAELYRNQMNTSLATTTPESERTDIISSMEHNSPLSVSLTSNEGLSTSFQSITELHNLQALAASPTNTANEYSSRSIPVTSSSIIVPHPHVLTSPTQYQPFASSSSSALTAAVRRTSSSFQASSQTTISIGPNVATATSTSQLFTETTATRLHNSSSSSSSSAL